MGKGLTRLPHVLHLLQVFVHDVLTRSVPRSRKEGSCLGLPLSRLVPFILTLVLLGFAPLLEGGTTHLAALMIRLQIILLSLAVLWFHVAAGRSVSASLTLLSPIVIFLVIASWSTITSPYPNQSIQWLITLVCYGLLAGSCMVVLSPTDHDAGVSRRLLRYILRFCVCMGLVETGIAVYQYAVLGELRPAGTFFNPNFLAAYLAPLLCFSLGLCMGRFPPQWRNQSRSPRTPVAGISAQSGVGQQPWSPIVHPYRSSGLFAGWIVAIVVLATGLALTGSRGGALAALAGLAVVMVGSFARKGLALLVMLLIGFLLIPNPLRDRLWLEHEANPVAYARLEMWTGGARMFLDHPLGVGLGLYKYFAPQYAFPVEGHIARYGKVPQTAHNEWLQFGVELGMPAFAVMVWAAVALGMKGWKTFRRTTTPRDRGLVIGLLAGSTTLLVHAAVDSVFHAPAVVLLFIILVAGLVGSSHGDDNSLPESRLARPERPNRRPSSIFRLFPGSRIVWGLFGTAALVVVTFVAVLLGSAWVTYEQGLEALQSHRYDQAVDQFKRAARLDPTNATYANALGAAHYHWAQELEGEAQERMLDAAVGHLQRAVQLNPVDGTLYGFLGWVSFNVARHRAGRTAFEHGSNPWIGLARRAYQQAMTRQPYKVSHQVQLATLYEATGWSKEAEALVQQAIRLEPNYLPARALLVKLALEKGNLEGARAEYQEIRTRFERYNHWSQTSLEAEFLDVDWGDLRAALAHTRRSDDAVTPS